MASPGGVRAGKAFIELFVNDAQMVRGLQAAESKLRSFGAGVANVGKQLTMLGGAVLAPLVGSSAAFAKMGDEAAKMAKRTGVSVEALTALRYAAEQTGTDFENLEVAFRKMQRSIFDASRGAKTQADALAELGLSFKELDGLSPEDQFKKIGGAIGGITDPTKKAALAMVLFGGAGTNLLPMFQRGEAGIDALMKKAAELGLVMSTEDAAAAEDFTDRLQELTSAFKMVVFQVGGALAPVLKDLAKRLRAILTGMIDWVKQNRQTVVTVAKIAAAVVAAGVALTGLGLAIMLVSKAIGIMLGLWLGVKAIFGIIAALITAIMSPLGLLIAGMAALGVYLIKVSGAGGQALSWLGGKFQNLKDTAMEAWGAIGDALASGDIALAARILWLTLKMEWQKGIQPLKEAWYTFQKAILDVGLRAWYNLLANLVHIWALLKRAWLEVLSFLQTQWNYHTSRMKRGWVRTQTDLAVMMVQVWAKAGIVENGEQIVESLRESERREVGGVDVSEKARADTIAKDYAAQQKAISSAASSQLASIGQVYEDLSAGNAAQFANELQATQDALNQTVGEWKDAISRARALKEGKSDDTPEGAPAALDLAMGGDALKQLATTGSFSAYAASQTGAGTLDKISDHTKKTAENTKRILDELEDGATFA